MAEQWHITEGISGDTIWDGDRPIGTVNKDVVHRMAAAQEMLEALVSIMERNEGEYCLKWEACIGNRHTPSCVDGQAAIAKAKGEADA